MSIDDMYLALHIHVVLIWFELGSTVRHFVQFIVLIVSNSYLNQ